MPPKKNGDSNEEIGNFEWTATCKHTLAKYVILKRAHLKEVKKPGILTQAAKWTAVLAELKARDEFAELNITAKSLGNTFSRFINDFLEEKGLTHQTAGRNNSGFKAANEFEILMIKLVQETRECEAKKKSSKSRSELKTALSNAVVKAGMAAQGMTHGLQIGDINKDDKSDDDDDSGSESSAIVALVSGSAKSARSSEISLTSKSSSPVGGAASLMAMVNEIKSALAQDSEDPEEKELKKELLKAQVKRERDRDSDDAEEKELRKQVLRAQIEMFNAQRRSFENPHPAVMMESPAKAMGFNFFK